MKNKNSGWDVIIKKLEVTKELIYLINYLNTTIRDIKDRTGPQEVIAVLEERIVSLTGDLTFLTTIVKSDIESSNNVSESK